MAHRHQVIILTPPDVGMPVLAADVLFFGSRPNVRRIDVDGSSNAASWASGGTTVGSCSDEEIARQYFSIYTGTEGVKWSDWDGSNTTLLSADNNPWELDTDGTYLYWAGFTNNWLRKCDKSDGSGKVTVKSAVGSIRGCQVDMVNEIVYMGIRNGTELKRVDTDGANMTQVLNTAGWIYAVDVDIDNEHVYYIEQTAEQIRRVDYDGSNDTLIYDAGGGSPDNQNIDGMAVDLEAGYIYWVDVLDPYVARCDLDGGNPDKTWYGPIGTNNDGLDIRYPAGSYYAKPNR